MKNYNLFPILLLILCFFATQKIDAQILENYWIYEDFSQFENDTVYFTGLKSYNTTPNNVALKTEYANFEETEGECNAESSSHLRIRGAMDGGYAEFTVSDAKKVIINVKGKSTSKDRIVNIYRNGILIESITDLDRNNCATFSETINSASAVTYKITGGDIESTKPVVITSILVSKYNSVVPACDVTVLANPDNMGYVSGGGNFQTDSEITLKATPYLGYKFENWTSKGQVISTENPFAFSLENDTTITANFKQEEGLSDIYWIYDDFSQFESAPDYIIEEKTYATAPNNFIVKTEYANLEQVEGSCNNESKYHLRIRGAADNGFAEFTVPNAKSVKVKIKGKSTSQDRIIKVYRNGSLIKSIMNLDRDNCAEFNDEVNSESPITYKFIGGDAISTKPVVITSIIVSKHDAAINYYDIVTKVAPEEAGSVVGGGTYYEGEKIQLKAIENLGYKFDSWKSNEEIISESNPYNFNVSANMTITAHFSKVDMKKYWIYDNFSSMDEVADYIMEEKEYKTYPNNVAVKAKYANFEKTEGDCHNESTLHLRVRGLLEDGYAEFTVPNATNVTICVKGKSIESDRIVNILRNGQIVKSYANLDKNTCAIFNEKINSKVPVTYKITAGDSESTKPIVITGIYVEKNGDIGIDNPEIDNLLNIYPNPVSDYMHIKFNENLQKAKISIFTITGICLLEREITNGEQLNLSNFSDGIYILQIDAENYNQTRKFIKQ